MLSEHDEFLAEYAQQHGLERLPQVEVVRHVTPQESMGVHNDCVAARGWTQLPDGAFQFPSDQERAFALTMYECMAAYPVDPAYSQSVTKTQWRAIYQYWQQETVPCLEGEGFDVPEPPSEEAFLANPTSWSPDSPGVRDQVAARVAQGDYRDVEFVFTQVCAVSPPAEVRLAEDR